MVSPTAITHVAYLDLDVFINLGASLILIALGFLILNILIAQQVIKVRLGRSKPIKTICNRLHLLLCEFFALSYDGFLVNINREIFNVFFLIGVGIIVLFRFSLGQSLVELFASFLKFFLQIFLLLGGHSFEVRLRNVKLCFSIFSGL